MARGRFLQRRAAAITTGLPESFRQTFWRTLCWTGHENHALEYVIKGRTEKPSSLLAYLRSSGLLLTGVNQEQAAVLPQGFLRQPAPASTTSSSCSSTISPPHHSFALRCNHKDDCTQCKHEKLFPVSSVRNASHLHISLTRSPLL